MDSHLRPMSTAEIFDRTFSLYRNNFLLFAGIAMLPAALALVLQLFGIAARITVFVPGRALIKAEFLFIGFQLLVQFVSSIVGGGIATAATVYAVYGTQLNQPATIASCYGKVRENCWTVIWAAIRVFLVTFAFLALGVAAIIFALPLISARPRGLALAVEAIILVVWTVTLWTYVAARYALVVPCVVLEETNVGEGFRRSRFLSKGAVGRIFLVLLLAAIIGYAFTWILQTSGMLFTSVFRSSVSRRLLTSGAQFLSSILAAPIATISVALIYIDQRVRKEAFDLQLMMDAIQKTGEQPQAMIQTESSAGSSF